MGYLCGTVLGRVPGGGIMGHQIGQGFGHFEQIHKTMPGQYAGHPNTHTHRIRKLKSYERKKYWSDNPYNED